VRSSRGGGRRPVLALWLALLAAYATSLGLAGDGTSGARYSAPEAHRLLSASSIAEDGSLDCIDAVTADGSCAELPIVVTR